MTIFRQPAGITADAQANWGLHALMQNANAYSLTPQAAIVTAGTNTTLTAIQATSGIVLLTAGASSGFTITLPSTSAILSALGPTIPVDGSYAEELFIQNNAIGQTGTVTAGDASTTLSGTMTIATSTTRVFLMTVTSASTISLTNIGSLAL